MSRDFSALQASRLEKIAAEKAAKAELAAQKAADAKKSPEEKVAVRDILVFCCMSIYSWMH